MEYHNELNRG